MWHFLIGSVSPTTYMRRTQRFSPVCVPITVVAKNSTTQIVTRLLFDLNFKQVQTIYMNQAQSQAQEQVQTLTKSTKTKSVMLLNCQQIQGYSVNNIMPRSRGSCFSSYTPPPPNSYKKPSTFHKKGREKKKQRRQAINACNSLRHKLTCCLTH